MKRLNIIIVMLTLLPCIVSGQKISDLQKYANNFHISTARSSAMGGAFHSLGGDLSVLSENPAGIAAFRTSHIAFTPTFTQSVTESKFSIDKRQSKANKFNFGLSNLGFVVPINTDDNPDWKSVNIGFTYNQRNNFNSKISIIGTNNETSLLDYIESSSQKIDPENLDPYGNRLFFDVFLIDTIENSNYQYVLPIAPMGESLIEQRKNIDSKGSISEYNISLGANFQNIFYIGTSFGIKSIYYNETSFYEEFNQELVPIEYDMANFSFKESFTTRGKGFDIKIGAIIVPAEWIRFSLAFQSPTFYTLEDNYDTGLSAEISFAGEEIYTSRSTVPGGDNPIGESIYDYEVSTPLKFSTGISTILNKKMILSFAFENLDYSNITISAMDYNYTDLQVEIKEYLQRTQNYKLGGEMRLTNNFSLRAGYANYGSPNKLEDKRMQIISGGLGINTGNFFLDIAHCMVMDKKSHILYDTYSDMTTVKGDLNINKGTTLITAGIRF